MMRLVVSLTLLFVFHGVALNSFDTITPIVKLSPAIKDGHLSDTAFGFSVTVHQIAEAELSDTLKQAIDKTM